MICHQLKVERINADVVIEELKKREMSVDEMKKMMGLSHSSKDNQRFKSWIVSLGYDIPIYSPRRKFYKILTNEDLTKYEDEHRNKTYLLKAQGVEIDN